MLIKNIKTGKIVDIELVERDLNGYLDEREVLTDNGETITIEHLFKNYVDYTPKEYYYIDTTEGAVVEKASEGFSLTDKERQEIGNYFDSEEYAKNALEKLKAWKRLKDAGIYLTLDVSDKSPYSNPILHVKIEKDKEFTTVKKGKELWKDLKKVFMIEYDDEE